MKKAVLPVKGHGVARTVNNTQGDGVGATPGVGRRSGARSFQLGFGPDLVITSRSAPSSAVPGAMLNTQVTMCNRGTTPGSTSRHVHRLDRRAHPIAPSDWLLPAPGNLFLLQVPNA